MGNIYSKIKLVQNLCLALSSLKELYLYLSLRKILSFKVTRTVGSKSNRSCRLQSSGKGTESRLQSSGKRTESLQDIKRLELSFSPCNDSLDQGGKRNTHRTAEDVRQNGKSAK